MEFSDQCKVASDWLEANPDKLREFFDKGSRRVTNNDFKFDGAPEFDGVVIWPYAINGYVMKHNINCGVEEHGYDDFRVVVN